MTDRATQQGMILKYLRGDASDEEKRRLAAVLEAQPEAVEVLVELSCQEHALHEVLSESVAAARARRTASAEPARRIRWGAWAAVAACLAIVAGSIVYNLRQSEQMPELIAAKVTKLTQTSGDVRVVRMGKQVVVVVGMELLPHDIILTGKDGRARVEYEGESTSIDLISNTKADFFSENGSKRISLDIGRVECVLAPQPAGRQMVLTTPGATLEVKGTAFVLKSTPAVTNVGKPTPIDTTDPKAWYTRLEVHEGLVRLTRRFDGAAIDVAAGHYAVASEGVELAAILIPKELVPPPVPLVTEIQKPRPRLYGRVLFEDDFDEGIDNWMVMVNPDSPGSKKGFLVNDGSQHLWKMEKNYPPGSKEGEGVSCVILHPNLDDMVKENAGFKNIMPMLLCRKGITAKRFVVEIRIHLGATRGSGTNILTDCMEMGESLSLFRSPRGARLNRGWHTFRAEYEPVPGYPDDVRLCHYWFGSNGDAYSESILMRVSTGRITFGVRNGIIAVDRVTVRELLEEPKVVE